MHTIKAKHDWIHPFAKIQDGCDKELHQYNEGFMCPRLTTCSIPYKIVDSEEFVWLP